MFLQCVCGCAYCALSYLIAQTHTHTQPVVGKKRGGGGWQNKRSCAEVVQMRRIVETRTSVRINKTARGESDGRR